MIQDLSDLKFILFAWDKSVAVRLKQKRNSMNGYLKSMKREKGVVVMLLHQN